MQLTAFHLLIPSPAFDPCINLRASSLIETGLVLLCTAIGGSADGSADFARAIGLAVDLNAAGMGVRSQRYAMVVDNGIVTIGYRWFA